MNRYNSTIKYIRTIVTLPLLPIDFLLRQAVLAGIRLAAGTAVLCGHDIYEMADVYLKAERMLTR
jgi:hypothetical protein